MCGEEFIPTQEDIAAFDLDDRNESKSFLQKHYLSKIPLDKPAAFKSTPDGVENLQKAKYKRWIDRLYNYNNFVRGALDKFEATRYTLNSDTLVDYVGTLYMLGYTHRQIFYAVCKLSRENSIPLVFRYWHINSIIQKFGGSQVQKDFLHKLREERMQVFQTLHESMREVEKKTLETYIKKIGQLNTALDALDPIAEPGKFKSIKNLIEALQFRVNEAHGINDARKGVIAAATTAMTLNFKEKFKTLSEGDADFDTAFGKVIEASSENLSLSKMSKALTVQ